MPKTSLPTLSPANVQTTEVAIARYEQIVAAGGWPRCRRPSGCGSACAIRRCLPLRTRLTLAGDLDPSAVENDVYDSYVEAAVRRFQARHGISADGRPGTLTFKALNIPAEQRLSQLKINLARLRAFDTKAAPRFVVCNIPAAQLEAIENGIVMSRHIAVVGKPDRPSPELNSQDRRDQFQSVLDRAGLDRAQGPDPEDAGRAGLSHPLQHPHPRPEEQRADAGAGQLVLRRGGELQVQAGSGRPQFARHHPHQFPQRARRLHARHAVQEPVRRGCPLRLLRLHAHPERARPGELAAVRDQWLVAHRDRRGDQVGRAQGRQAQAAGAAALDLRHRLGDRRRRGAVPRRHLQSRWAEPAAASRG